MDGKAGAQDPADAPVHLPASTGQQSYCPRHHDTFLFALTGSDIQANGIPEFLGYFDDEVEAARAYNAAARRLHRRFAFLNFPADKP